MSAKDAIEFGQEFPYDSYDDESSKARPLEDWAHLAARAVIANLTDRRSIKRGFENVDEDVRFEIVDTMADIIREAKKMEETP